MPRPTREFSYRSLTHLWGTHTRTESTSARLVALGRLLGVFLVPAVSSKRIEAIITVEYCFSHWDGMGDVHAQNELYLFDGALHNVFGETKGSASGD